ncbi:MAG: helicase-related protein, partial [Burkholderiales bacterium]
HVLVATDIAARGLDIDQLPHVVNFELPNVPEDYVHRIGRTGRAGTPGAAVSLVDREEMRFLTDIERMLKVQIPRVRVDDFVPPPVSQRDPVEEDRPPRTFAPRRTGSRPTGSGDAHRGGPAKRPSTTGGGGGARSGAAPRTAGSGAGPRGPSRPAQRRPG